MQNVLSEGTAAAEATRAADEPAWRVRLGATRLHRAGAEMTPARCEAARRTEPGAGCRQPGARAASWAPVRARSAPLAGRAGLVRATRRQLAARAGQRGDAQLGPALGQPAQIDRRGEPGALDDAHPATVDSDLCADERVPCRLGQPDLEAAAA